jgi:hypothetical protein
MQDGDGVGWVVEREKPNKRRDVAICCIGKGIRPPCHQIFCFCLYILLQHGNNLLLLSKIVAFLSFSN